MKLFSKSSRKKADSTKTAPRPAEASSIFTDTVPDVPEKKKESSAAANSSEGVKESSLNAILGEDDLLKIPLEELTSKQRRLLRRKLARGDVTSSSDNATDEKATVKAPPETVKPEGEGEQSTDVPAKAPASDSALDLKAMDAFAKAKLLKKLSRKGGVNAPIVQTPKKVKDWSHLPPDERARREDQRRKQVVAKAKKKRKTKVPKSLAALKKAAAARGKQIVANAKNKKAKKKEKKGPSKENSSIKKTRPKSRWSFRI